MDDDREILTPLAGLKRRAEHGGAQVAPGSVPTRALFAWGEPIFEVAKRYARAKPMDLKAGVAPLWRGTWGGENVVIVNPGVGAPATALVAEKLHACGVDTIVGVGFAGILHPLLSSGDVLVVEKAIGEDGASHAYLEPAIAPGEEVPDVVEADKVVKEALELALGEEPGVPAQCGTVWTTDTPYRETVAKARHYRQRGAHAVEMETAALLAVAKHRGFRAGALVVLSDSLCRLLPLDQAVPEGSDGLEWSWKPAPTGSVRTRIEAVVRAALPVATGPLQPVEAHEHAH